MPVYGTAEATASVISLPATVMEGQFIDITLKGNTVNVLLGEDFTSGVGGFIGTYGSVANVNGKLEYTTTSLNVNAQIQKALTFSAGDKLYIQYKINPKYASNGCMARIGGQSGTILYPAANVESTVSDIITTINNIAGLEIHHGTSTNYVVGEKFTVDDVMVINLTQSGLTSLTKAECDARFGFMSTGTKSTLSERVKSVGKNLFDISKPLYVGALSAGDFVSGGANYVLDGTKITITSSSNFRGVATDFIKVDQNTAYRITWSGMAGGAHLPRHRSDAG
jgi:hypothetical protein